MLNISRGLLAVILTAVAVCRFSAPVQAADADVLLEWHKFV